MSLRVLIRSRLPELQERTSTQYRSPSLFSSHLFSRQSASLRRSHRCKPLSRSSGCKLVAMHHVLRNALQADNRIGNQGRAPEPVVMLAQVISAENGNGALGGGDRVSPAHGRVGAIEISGFHFHVANALFPGEVIFAGEQGGVRVGECAAGRDYGEAYKREIDRLLLRNRQNRARNDGLDKEAIGARGFCYCAGSVWQLFGHRGVLGNANSAEDEYGHRKQE